MQFLAQHDVRAGNDLVVDERNRFFGADSFMPRVPIFDEGTFRKNLDTAAVFSLARTVTPIEKEDSTGQGAAAGADQPRELGARRRRRRFRTARCSFVARSTSRARCRSPSWYHEHPPAPPDQGAAKPGAGGRMIVFGDSDFASNLYLNLLGNKDLFMSSVGVLAEDQELIAVRRKGLPRSSLSPVSLTERQGRMIFWSAVIMQPVGFALLGMLITWRRRRRASA